MPFIDPDPLVLLRAVSYQYPRSAQFALKNLDLEVREGEILGIIGPTGAGKTTLCLAMNGIVPQFFGGRFFGNIQVAGYDTVEHPINFLARFVGQVFEDPETQLLATSVENEVAFPLENLKIPREEIRARIQEALALVRLDGLEKKHPHELSSGQKQRLAIAAAIAVRPRLLVLDEPTSQLDPEGAERLFSTIRELNRELEVTVLIASHAAEEMAASTDRLALLAGGEIIAAGTPNQIYSEIELLEKHDLRPPQVASTFFGLRKKAFPVDLVPVTLAQALPLVDRLAVECLPPGHVSPEQETHQHKKYPSPSVLAPVGERSSLPLIAVKDLVHVYPDGTRALNGVSLDIYPGEYVLIVGQNGAGKTTLVKHLLSLLQPSQGSVLIQGKDAGEWTTSELAQRIGYVAQNPDHQIFNTTVKDEIGFALKNLGFSPQEVEKRVAESLDAMGLTGVREYHPLSLPKGDRARVVIGAILAMQPEVVIFDEPTTGQDYRGAMRILELSKALHRLGKTVIVISHHLYLMAEIASRHLEVRAGSPWETASGGVDIRVIVMGNGTILSDEGIRKSFFTPEVLQQSYLAPPQAVQLALEFQRKSPGFPALLTPREIIEFFADAQVPNG